MNPIDSQTLDELNRYINGDLSVLEKEIFESRLDNEPQLREWLAWLKETSAGMKKTVINDHKTQVKEWLAEDKITTQSKRNRGKQFLMLTILISLIGLAVYFLFFKAKKGELSTIQIADAYIETPYKSPTILRSAATNNWQQSIQYYSSGDYNSFLNANAKLIEEGKANNEQKFYFALGNIYKTPPDYEVAIQYLTELMTINSGYEDLALWYRGLLYSKTNEFSKAKTDFKTLISRSKFKVEEAQKILNSM